LGPKLVFPDEPTTTDEFFTLAIIPPTKQSASAVGKPVTSSGTTPLPPQKSSRSLGGHGLNYQGGIEVTVNLLGFNGVIGF